MKGRFEVCKRDSRRMDFYYVYGRNRYYLFSQRYSKGVRDYFRGGRSELEVRAYKNWNTNPRLDKTIEKLRVHVKYIQREAISAKATDVNKKSGNSGTKGT